ncbi:PIG-L family deacetylase [Photobacterium gaetbulicola]|uniref:LmbE family protein n=1 Tax=Photobacterium gaetbulicola Gung47 TaxID=658445 RepID=A0A0C5WNP2_9GAMM|nr:PIG-L family deacetylase [Photobacterium gaetbulicola]AJR08713.1 hypothetical protein H744_2c2049 [Photobacterium gaetbulicola Gung47]PSU10346.1 PIG-L family deacetylase [Photobacterium gaetbulicola]
MKIGKSPLKTAVTVLALAMVPSVVSAQTYSTIPEQNLYFLSPHPDDILLTFGGLISKLANEGSIEHKTNVTEVFFSLSNYSTNHLDILTNKRVLDITKMRFNEDFSAHTEMFGSWNNFRYKTAGFYDAPLRLYEGSPTAGGGPGGTFSDFRQAEIDVYNRIAADITPILKQEDCAAFVLLANGSHIDHFVVREAVMKAAHDLGKDAQCQIYFGEDQPYTGANPDKAQDELNTIKARLPNNAISKITYWYDKDYKLELFKKYYLSQYDVGYIPPLESAEFENIYKWDKSTYGELQKHHLCNSSYCSLN